MSIRKENGNRSFFCLRALFSGFTPSLYIPSLLFLTSQILGNVRTVQAFAGEEKAVNLYKGALRNTYKYGRKAGLAKGLGLGSMHCVLFLSWALLVWFTSIIVHKGIANGGDSFTTMLNVVISGL